MGDETKADFAAERRRHLGLDRWDALYRATEPARLEQQANIDRVSDRIAGAILTFCRQRVGKTFHADELRQHCESVCGKTAPGSADRILRDLRAKGSLSYSVVSRSQSLYHLTACT